MHKFFLVNSNISSLNFGKSKPINMLRFGFAIPNVTLHPHNRSNLIVQLKYIMSDEKVETSLSNLSIAPSRKTKESKKQKTAYEAELEKTGFRKIFKPIDDHGYYSWRPTGLYKSMSNLTSTTEVTDFIELDSKPKSLLPLSQLRFPFTCRDLVAHEHANKYPYGSTYMASLHVAAKYRGVDFDKIDFVFGGSTLQMLASHDTTDPFMVARIPLTNTILVVKCKEYIQNYSDFGFQFERFVTDEKISSQDTGINWVEHLHTVQVLGKYCVLFCAEVDALLDHEPVEITASNSKYWGTRIVFQMISNGSPMLCHGIKQRGAIMNVELLQLSKIARDAIANANYKILINNIRRGMEHLQEQMAKAEDGRVFKVTFSGRNLRLESSATRQAALVPSKEIVKELMEKYHA